MSDSLKYIDRLLSKKCAGDVLGIVGPMNHSGKEISEAMAIIERIKLLTIASPMKYTVVDLCSGNALLPVISASSLPTRHNYAVDLRPRKRPWDKVRRFTYYTADIHSIDFLGFLALIDGPVILTSVHPCKSLAQRAVELYRSMDQVEHLTMMP